MSGNQLLIRVGASVDRDLKSSFRPLLDAARAARKQIAEEMSAAAKHTKASAKEGTSAAEKAFAELASEVERGGKKMLEPGAKAVQDFGKQSKHTFDQVRRDFDAMARETDKVLAGRERRDARERLRLGEPGGGTGGRGRPDNDNFGRMVKSGVLRASLGAARFGGHVLAGEASAMGANLDLIQAGATGVDLEKRATDLVNAGFMPGHAGAAGTRQHAGDVLHEVRAVGMETATDPTKAMEGLQAFVGKTGDLETGRAILKDMARYSRATGASLEDMVDAAGDVSNALGDTDNKGEKVKAVMRAIAAQGKEGAVEIKDLATQMAKLGAAAGTFAGDPEHVMAEMGALAQMARAKGGSSSATQAATSVSSFTNTFSKGGRLNAFKAFGVDVRDESGKVRDPMEVILAALKAASSKERGGMKNLDENMGKMFTDVRARGATRGFETIFKENGGGDAGLAAVKAAMDELIDSTMKETEITRSFNDSMNTAEAKVQLFNNQMEQTGNELRENLQPALQELAPLLIDLAKAASQGIGWLTGREESDQQHVYDTAEGRASAAASALLPLTRNEYNPDATGNMRAQTKTITAAQLQEGADAEKALNDAIDQKQRDVTGERTSTEYALPQDPKLVKAMADAGDKHASKLVADEAQLHDMREQFEKLHAANSAVERALTTGTLKVAVVRDDTRPAQKPPPPAVDHGARTPPPKR